MSSLVPPLQIRPVTQADHHQWLPLWQGYNAFYGRAGETALPEGITQATWEPFLKPLAPVFALVAESEGELVGLAHSLFHRSTRPPSSPSLSATSANTGSSGLRKRSQV